MPIPKIVIDNGKSIDKISQLSELSIDELRKEYKKM